MKRILFDVNVVLDVLLDRKPHATASGAVWAAIEAGIAEGLLSAHAVITIHYLARKDVGPTKTREILSAILTVFRIAPIDTLVIQEALQLPFTDFEDAVTSAAARRAGCNHIVTRDPKGFRGSPVRCLTPEMAMQVLRAE